MLFRSLLDRLRLLPFEGSTEGRQLHKEARLMLALEKMKAGAYAEALPFIADARQWPENLGAGKPYAADLDERLEDWLEAVCDEQYAEIADENVLDISNDTALYFETETR